MSGKFDIFISYRNEGGFHPAQKIFFFLDGFGYKVFFDKESIKDGTWENGIEQALNEAPIFLLVLSEGMFKKHEKGDNEEDIVRKEIFYAAEHGKSFIPINVDGHFDGYSDNQPVELKKIIHRWEHTTVYQQKLKTELKEIVKDRIIPNIGKPHNDSEFEKKVKSGDEDFQLGRYKEAKKNFIEAKKLNYATNKTTPTLSELFFKIGYCAYKLGQEDEAIDAFRDSSDQIPDSLFYLGDIFENGEQKNKLFAFTKYTDAAQRGSTRAINRIEKEIELLESNASNLHSLKKYEEAINLYKRAIDLTDADWYKKPADNQIEQDIAFKGSNVIAKHLLNSNYRSACLEYEAVLSLRISRRCYNIGKMLYEKKDYLHSIDWFKKASERGYAEADYILGVIYCQGLGTTADKEIGYEYYLDAAKSGHVLAQMEVAKYHQKNGYPDLAEAWWRMAAEKGNSNAQFELALFLYNPQIDSIYAATIDLDERKERQKEAASWYEKSANQGNPNAMHRLAWMYLWGVGVEKDIDNAFALYRKAISTDCAEKENITKNFITALTMIASKKMESEDYKGALELYLEAASLGDNKHYKLISFIYQSGTNDVKDAEKAIEWYLKVIDEGDTSVFGTLGKLYVVYKQISKAEDSFRKAIAAGDNAAKQDLASLLNSEGDNLMASSYINGCSDSFDNNLIKSISK